MSVMQIMVCNQTLTCVIYWPQDKKLKDVLIELLPQLMCSMMYIKSIARKADNVLRVSGWKQCSSLHSLCHCSIAIYLQDRLFKHAIY